MYRDYAISPTLFHWETQSRTSVGSPTGQRYINHARQGSNILLFAREHKVYELGTAPYLFLGTAQYVSHTGDRPIAITWKLHRPMPTDAFAASVGRGVSFPPSHRKVGIDLCDKRVDVWLHGLSGWAVVHAPAPSRATPSGSPWPSSSTPASWTSRPPPSASDRSSREPLHGLWRRHPHALEPGPANREAHSRSERDQCWPRRPTRPGRRTCTFVRRCRRGCEPASTLQTLRLTVLAPRAAPGTASPATATSTGWAAGQWFAAPARQPAVRTQRQGTPPTRASTHTATEGSVFPDQSARRSPAGPLMPASSTVSPSAEAPSWCRRFVSIPRSGPR